MKKLLLLILISTIFLFGCGNSKEAVQGTESNDSSKTPTEQFDWTSVLENLTDGQFYVLKEKDFTEVYRGNGTFEIGATTTSSEDSRVLWFKDDFTKIPTLYKGDSLIFYSTEVLTEEFNFERFEDLGYSIGLCQMQETLTGRVMVETDYDSNTTYPGGDTEQVINYFEQPSVIIDTFGKVPLTSEMLSRSGTIIGLQKDMVYDAEVYGGTILTDAKFKADVRILASMDVYQSNDYAFLSSYVIRVNIPEHFNSGYYCINGLGLFRYINSNKETYKKNNPQEDFINTNPLMFNIPNNTPAEELNEENNNTDNKNEEETGKNKDNRKEVFFNKELGERKIVLNLTNDKGEAIDASKYNVVITSPSGESWSLVADKSTLFQVINFKELGDYIIGFAEEPDFLYTISFE